MVTFVANPLASFSNLLFSKYGLKILATFLAPLQTPLQILNYFAVSESLLCVVHIIAI